jgi:hypothetical protein
MLWLFILTGSGCATYSDHTEAARQFASQGDYDAALGEFDKLLGVEDSHTEPDTFGGDTALILLERAMLHQAKADYDGSRLDLQVADKELEILDLTNSTATDIARYLYSDSASPYKISPVERLTLNAINILNYLATGDLRGARVEAKRFTVMRNFMKETAPDHTHGAIGSYLAGFVHEMLDENDSAMRYYDEALEERRLESLVEPVSELAPRAPYRGSNISALLEQTSPSIPSGGGQILVVAGVGRAPFKMPKRMPIGLAVGIVGADITGDLDVLERSAFKVLVFPELVPGQGTFHTARTRVDGQMVPMDQVTNLSVELTREYEENKPKVIAAAVTRMITRAVAAEAARKAGNEIGGNSALLGTLASFIGEGLLVAADRPDTRSWTLLPESLFVSRMRVSAGTHEVQVGLGPGDGAWRTSVVDVPENGFAIVVVMPLY